MDRLNFADIDIGSNAVRLLIKGIYPGESVSDLSKVFIVRVPLRLGQDTFTKGRISTEKTEKLLRLMHAFSQLMQVYNVLSYRACATSAMRDSSNGADIVRYISKSFSPVSVLRRDHYKRNRFTHTLGANCRAAGAP